MKFFLFSYLESSAFAKWDWGVETGLDIFQENDLHFQFLWNFGQIIFQICNHLANISGKGNKIMTKIAIEKTPRKSRRLSNSVTSLRAG
jgi:hypothetical protein